MRISACPVTCKTCSATDVASNLISPNLKSLFLNPKPLSRPTPKFSSPPYPRPPCTMSVSRHVCAEFGQGPGEPASKSEPRNKDRAIYAARPPQFEVRVGGGAVTSGGCPDRQKRQLEEELEKIRQEGDVEGSDCHEKVCLPADFTAVCKFLSSSPLLCIM